MKVDLIIYQIEITIYRLDSINTSQQGVSKSEQIISVFK